MPADEEREESATAWPVRHRSGYGKWRIGAGLDVVAEVQECGVCGLRYV